MRYFVRGEPVELESGAKVSELHDRLMVRTPDGSFSGVAIRDGDAILVSYKGHQYRLETRQKRPRSGADSGSGEYRAPMPCQIVDVLKNVGESVEKGEKILVIEAMKTQQSFSAPFAGTLSLLNAKKGNQVAEGDLLAIVTKSE